MKKCMLVLSLVLTLILLAAAACADDADILGAWYYTSYEDSESYPGIVFTADGSGQYFSVYTDGENLIVVDHQPGGTTTHEAVFEDGVLSGLDKYTLEDGKMVRRYGSVTEVYTREPQEAQIPADRTNMYASAIKPEDYNGRYMITQYGMYNAFIDAESMGLSGYAVIEDGKITVTWTRNGKEKSFDMTFDPELNKGRLYTVVNDAVSYIVSMRADHTILLNIGLNQVQWVMRKENVIDESLVSFESPAFEEAFAGRKDWTASEESRNEMAALLLDTAAANGVDLSAVSADSAYCLAAVSLDPDYPVLICEGAGEYENYLLTIGRGIHYETKKPFVYWQWENRYFTRLAYPDETVVDYQRTEIFPLIAGDQVWPVLPEVSE